MVAWHPVPWSHRETLRSLGECLGRSTPQSHYPAMATAETPLNTKQSSISTVSQGLSRDWKVGIRAILTPFSTLVYGNWIWNIRLDFGEEAMSQKCSQEFTEMFFLWRGGGARVCACAHVHVRVFVVGNGWVYMMLRSVWTTGIQRYLFYFPCFLVSIIKNSLDVYFMDSFK